MANIGLDGRIRNDENAQDAPLRSKQMLSNDGRTIKKQVFGELKNVMQNQQIGLTPIRGNAAKIDGLPGKFGASSSLCNDVLRKQQLKQNFLDAQKQLQQKLKVDTVVESYKEPVFDEDMFDSWDYDRKCCQNHKREEEIWAEMDFERLNFDRLITCKIDEDKTEACPKDPMLLEDLDDGFLEDLPVFDSMVEPEISTLNSSIDDFSPLDFFEDLEF